MKPSGESPSLPLQREEGFIRAHVTADTWPDEVTRCVGSGVSSAETRIGDVVEIPA